MLKAIAAAALFVTPFGLLGILAGDAHLLSTGNYRLMALLWAVHLTFWLLYQAFVGTAFVVLARGGRRVEGEEILGQLLAGVFGFVFAFGSCLYYLHKDLGFFSPSRLPINAAVFLGLMALAHVAFRAARDRSGAVARRWWAFPATGLLLAAGIWGLTIAQSIPNDAELDIDSLPAAVTTASSNPAPGEPGRAGHRIVLLGLDGADWKEIDPLIAAGKLPHFATIKNDGVWAPMETVSPFSPVVWTSIATGMDPGRHSVQYFSEMYSPALDVTVQRLNYNFLEPLLSRFFTKIPVSSTTRTSKALWEIFAAFGRESLVINWWASFPAEPGRGIMVSNYAMPWDEINPERLARVGPAAQRIWPESIWPEAVEVMTTALGGVSASSGEGTDLEKKITNVDFWDARDRIATALFRKFDSESFSLSALYLQGIDTTSHHYSESIFGANKDLPRPARVGDDVIGKKRAMLDDVYMRMDALIGEQMALQKPGDLLVVVSDHGWRYDGTSHWRFPDAIFAAFGSGVKGGFTPGRIHVYDVAPTILRYSGLPVSREMPGRSLDEIFRPEIGETLPRVSIVSYGPRIRPIRLNDPAMDAEYRSKLKSLGYVQ